METTSTELAKFDKIKAELQTFVGPVLQVKVTDQDSSAAALRTGSVIKDFQKQVEAVRDSLVRPLNQRVKEINAYAKQIQEPLGGAEMHLKKELRAWELKLEAERQELLKKAEAERKAMEEKARAEAEERRKEAEMLAAFGTGEDAELAKAEADVIEERAVVQAEAHQRATVTQLSEKKVEGARKTWAFEVFDGLAVPREFLIVDEKAIRRAIMAGTREIPGVRIYQETSIALGR